MKGNSTSVPVRDQKRQVRRIKAMRSLRRAGVSVSEIARRYGLSESRVREVTAGARPRDDYSQARYPAKLYQQVAEAREKGFLIKDIALHFGIPLSTTSAILRRAQGAKRLAGLTLNERIEEIMERLKRGSNGV